MNLAAILLAVAIVVAISVVAFRLGRGRSRPPAGGARVTIQEVMETDALLRRMGGLDEADKRQERQALTARTRAVRVGGGLGDGSTGGGA